MTLFISPCILKIIYQSKIKYQLFPPKAIKILMRLKLQKRGALKFASRIIP
jgi:hypothetical protein